jgi:hypothetical protein
MFVRIDVGQVPPVLEVGDQDDFTRFSVVVAVPPHAWVDTGALSSLADRSEDSAWKEQLGGMVRFAETKGWLDEHGRVRAHVEVERLHERGLALDENSSDA